MSALNLDTALKAIPTFNGSFTDLDSFITIITLINSNLNDVGKRDLLNLVFHVKLSNNVKTALGSHSPPSTLDSFINLLKERYKNNITLPKIYSKLSNMTQRNHSISAFKDHLLNTISDLNRLQIEQLGSQTTEIQKQVIITTNDMQAMHIFKNGLDDKYKQTVIAAQPKILTEAVNIALEIEANTNNNSNIMQINRSGNYNRYNNNRNFSNRYNNNFNNNNTFRRNNNNNSHRNYNNNTNRNNYNNQNRNNYNNNYPNRNNYNHNYNSNQNRNNNNNRNNYSNNQHNNNNSYRNNNNNNRPARVHLTNDQGNDHGSDCNNPESQN